MKLNKDLKSQITQFNANKLHSDHISEDGYKEAIYPNPGKIKNKELLENI